jgi:hypothetical protein
MASRVRIPVAAWIYFLLLNANLPINGYWVSFNLIKRLGRKVDHSPVPRALVKNEWSYTSTPPVSLQRVAKTTLSPIFNCFSIYKTYSLLLTNDPI